MENSKRHPSAATPTEATPKAQTRRPRAGNQPSFWDPNPNPSARSRASTLRRDIDAANLSVLHLKKESATRKRRRIARPYPPTNKVISLRCTCGKQFSLPPRSAERTLRNNLIQHLWGPTHALGSILAHSTADALIALKKKEARP